MAAPLPTADSHAALPTFADAKCWHCRCCRSRPAVSYAKPLGAINKRILNVKEKIAEEGYDPEYGARPLIRAIQKTVEDNLSELILDGNQIEGKEVTIDHDGDEFKYDIHEKSDDKETTEA